MTVAIKLNLNNLCPSWSLPLGHQQFLLIRKDYVPSRNMDDIIPYNDIMEMLKIPPTLAPQPNFFHLRVFRWHIVDVMKQIPHPCYPQHGWAGMVLQPAIFALINAMPFVPLPNPGLIATYPPFALQPAIQMINSQFKIDKKHVQNVHKRLPSGLQSPCW